MTIVSILIPHFNDPDGLALTLRSVEAQTWKGDREVVVVDDGSKPEVQARLEEVVEASSERVRLVRNPQNRGRPYTRNVLLDSADGKYITWCDAGDEFYPEKLERQLEGLYRARFVGYQANVWCICNYDMHWANRRATGRNQEVNGDLLGNLMLSTLRAYLFTLLGSTQSFRDVGYFDTNLPRLQDLDFFIRFVTKGGMFVLPSTHTPLCVYHKSDVGKAGDEILRCSKYIYKKHEAALMTHSRRFRRNRQFDHYMLAARFTANNNDLLKTIRYRATAAFYSPVAFSRRLPELVRR
jgi:glycosyltransferase involved in cell wall biosynthesis